MNERPCYELLATDIRDMGVERVFGLMSADTARFVATLDAIGVKFHSARHENNACSMAEGYASASGKLGMAIMGRGPAAANAVHGATYAKRTGSRVLLIFGEAPLAAAPGRAIGPDGKAFEGAAVLRAAGIPVYCPSDAAHARQLLQDAAAATLREGAVALLLPGDVQMQVVDADATRPQQREAAQQKPIAPRAAAIDTAAALLLRARRADRPRGPVSARRGSLSRTASAARRPSSRMATSAKPSLSAYSP